MARFNPITFFERREDITPERLNSFIEEISKATDVSVDQRSSAGSASITSAAAAITDHGLMVGLEDDDHSIYALADGSRGAFEAAGAIAAHTAEADPHPGYLTAVEASATYAAKIMSAIYQDQKASGVDGGTLTAGWNTRDLNTFQANTSVGEISGSGSSITLEEGQYLIRVSAPASMVGLHQLRIYDVTNSVAALLGSSEWSGAVNTRATLEGILIVSATTEYRVEHYVQNTVANTGGGVASDSGELELYTIVTILKLS